MSEVNIRKKNGVLTAESTRFKLASKKPKTFVGYATMFNLHGEHIVLVAPSRAALERFCAAERSDGRIPPYSPKNFMHVAVYAAKHLKKKAP